MAEWPAQRPFRRHAQASNPPRPTFLADLLQFESAQSVRQRVKAEVLAAFHEQRDPSQSVVQLERLSRDIKDAVVTEPDEVASAVLVSACVDALIEEPTGKMWEFLWSLAWHSAAVEHSLPEAVAVHATHDEAFRREVLSLAGVVVDAAIASPGRRAYTTERNLPRQLRDDWLENPRLSRLWWGHIEQHARSFQRGDDGIFHVLARLDTREFLRLLDLFDYPYPIASALMWAGGHWSYDRWRELFEAAPVAFEGNGRWNGSAILPLLLYDCQHQIRPALRNDAATEEVDAATAEINAVAKEVATLLSRRPDAVPCARRWATWLIRSPIMGDSKHRPPYPANAQSVGFPEAALIDALAAEISPEAWGADTPPDAEAWEPWCYQGVLVTVANARASAVPPAIDLLAEFNLSPEEWEGSGGAELKGRASLLLKKGPDAYGNRLLAYPLANTDDPLATWERLWWATRVMREVVEFGSAQRDHGLNWEERRTAAELVRLCFGIGLMILDTLAQSGVGTERHNQASTLLKPLTGAAREMTAIDMFGTDYWTDAWRHLAIRRAIWFEGQPNVSTSPSLADYFEAVSQQTDGLLVLLELCDRNRVPRAVLQTALNDARVDLGALIDLVTELRELDPRRAGVSETQLNFARSFLLGG